MLGWWSYRHVQKLGRFQLENILSNQVPFSMFSLVRENIKFSEKFKKLMASAEYIPKARIFSEIIERTSNKDRPIILICENGYKSATVAYKLQKAGYTNCYILERGLKCLV